MQAYAGPFESGVLDRVMIWVHVTLFLQIVIGILYCTEIGAGDMQGTLTVIWFVFVFACGFGIVKHLISDVQRYKTQNFLNWCAAGQDCPINVTWYCQAVLNNWVDTAQKTDWELMSKFAKAIKKYPIPEHLADPILMVVKGAPELLDLVLFAPDTSQERTDTYMNFNDTNGDGKIDKGEWEAAGGNPEVFDHIDVNGDGELDFEELEAMVSVQMSIDTEMQDEKMKPMSLKICEELGKRYENLSMSNRVEADRNPISSNSILAVFQYLYSSISQNRAKVKEEEETQAKELAEAVSAEAAAKQAEWLFEQAKQGNDKEKSTEAEAAATAARMEADNEKAEVDAIAEFPEDMICDIFKEAQWGKVFWYLAHCSTEEKYITIQCFIMLVTGDLWGYKKVDSVLNTRGEQANLDDVFSKMTIENMQIPTKKEDPAAADDSSTSSVGEEAKMLPCRIPSPKASPKTFPKMQPKEAPENESESEDDGIETSSATVALQVNPLNTDGDKEKQGLLGPHAALYLRYFNRYDVDLSGTVNNGSEFEMMTINLLTTGLTVSCAASCIASIGCSSTVCCVLCIDCKLNNG